ncbi:sulfotransferase family 2 domain-containing protein [Synechococcus sp. ROS8604]|uniref:sulfotransferase family 2 domain-containing protein n=1 Tax=Synechococcus sp. ROS8604 TaxID=1442557 RepID=UPI0016457A1E|nr:sulfotransferase family 2 domain-containing protein [Synechococcus sp. ROS8604]QNI86912.1 hypothetical protein SynROS8604_00241 [Synechococcus sp. ROS8604]
MQSEYPNILAFMHLYKCGGTTFNWALQNAFPSRVLYCENKDSSGSRIDIEKFISYTSLDSLKKYSAVSSHLIDYKCLSEFSVVTTILRDPLSRLVSAYNFDFYRSMFTGTFDQYIDIYVNMMSKALGSEFINLLSSSDSRCALFLEDLDLSIIYLESMIKLYGYDVNLAFPSLRLNISKGKVPQAVSKHVLTDDQKKRFRFLNRDDIDLYRQQSEFFKATLPKLCGDIDSSRREFSTRKLLADEKMSLIKSYGQGPAHFVYI